MGYYYLVHQFKCCTNKRNKQLRNKNPKVATKEMLSRIISHNLCIDINMLTLLELLPFPHRYSHQIIRNMCEQVIEYRYIMKNPNLISLYFGSNIRYNKDFLKKDVEQIDISAIITQLKKSGQSRFSLNGDKKTAKRNVWNMADKTNQSKSSDDVISLYDIYRICSEWEHNSYFQSFIYKNEKTVPTIKEKIEFHKFNHMLILFIISAFQNVYFNNSAF